MGAKDSKPSFITYEDAEKRVSDHELRRIREAFKRCAGNNGSSLSLDAFVHEVLCDGVPYKVAEWLFQACGGTKRGIEFKNLLCGIVVLTKGNREEKIKFLWTLYVNTQSDNSSYIFRRDFEKVLRLENSSLPVTRAQKTNETLLSLFGSGEKVTFEQFRSWLLMHRDATVLSQWLLSGRSHDVQDLETPTFYQSLAGVTHLEERDIIELEKCFWSLRNGAPTGQLDVESLTPLLSPPLPRAAVPGLVLAFDENRDGHVDFKELCCGLSAACRGPAAEQLKFCFKIFDKDRDGVLNQKELSEMADILCLVANEAAQLEGEDSRPPTPTTTWVPADVLADLQDKLEPPKPGKKLIFQLGPKTEGEEIVVSKPSESPSPESEEGAGGVLSQEEFLLACAAGGGRLGELLPAFRALLLAVGHVVLGLRPHCRRQERDVVEGWLRRESARGFSVGQFWYLVGAEWWARWRAWACAAPCDHCDPAPSAAGSAHSRPADEAIVCDESFTTTSTESMGSLLWRAESGSVGSGSGSSGVGSAAPRPRHPGPIDNKRLLAPSTLKVRTLTGEGGHLRRDVTLAQHHDFELLPDALWRALALWYGGPSPLPRQVIRPPNSDVELELYPLQLKILRHVPSPQRVSTLPLGAGGGGGGAAAGGVPERQLAYTAAFSRLATVKQVSEFLCSSLGLARESVRLWALGASAVLLDDERRPLDDLRLTHGLLLEQRNTDLTWPEELGALSGNRATERRETLIAPNMPGATGLNNLGNTCFMNAALQSLWNTRALMQYFTQDRHRYEITLAAPAARGALALSFGDLCKEVWSGRARTLAPLRVRAALWARARWLVGGGQQDAQELLAWLLGALHDDLGRAPPSAPAPAPAPPAPAAQPHDADAARRAWDAFARTDSSIITDLFYGQLKSRVRCDVCGTESTRFDTFNMLSLPLPMDTSLRLDVRVILLDGSVPVKYGVLVNSEGTYLDLKKKLSELCGLPPESLVVVELAGATIGRVFSDDARLQPTSAELTAYQRPAALLQRGHGPAAAAGCVEVSVPRAHNSLCMPALFCFKRSRSELVMSQSPGEPMASGGPTPNASPTPSTRSLGVGVGLGTESPKLSAKFGSSPSDMYQMRDLPPPPAPAAPTPAPAPVQYLVAVHRKQCRMDAYFLPSQRCKPALFGVPLLVGLWPGMTGRDLYAAVWTQVARLLSAKPPAQDQSNHATDCDDSLGYEFPFTLRVVRAGGAWCYVCGWPALCRGCGLAPGPRPLRLACEECEPDSDGEEAAAAEEAEGESPGAHLRGGGGGGCGRGVRRLALCRAPGPLLAVEWEPTALHLRYQVVRERLFTAHRSLGARGPRGVDLRSCLRAFTADERLEQPYHCGACRARRPARKTLQLWRLPPVLIIHLKRFQFVNNKWIKSQKVVNFPFEDFDPTDFLASVPYETIKRHRELTQCPRPSSPLADVGEIAPDSDDEHDEHEHHDDREEHMLRLKAKRFRGRRRSRLQSTSLKNTPVQDDQLHDYHQHRLRDGADPFDLRYQLYAVVSHSGQLSGGHYVSFALNPSGAWLSYNDSECREVNAPAAIDPAHAYLLFYQRRDLQHDRYLPAVSGAPPPLPPDDELAKSCALV